MTPIVSNLPLFKNTYIPCCLRPQLTAGGGGVVDRRVEPYGLTRPSLVHRAEECMLVCIRMWDLCHLNVAYTCKTSGFRGGDYEEFRLLGYENPVRTPQVTHYICATERSRLMLCKI
jgi:hypothetical protein